MVDNQSDAETLRAFITEHGASASMLRVVDGLVQQKEAAYRLAEAAMYVGMWGESHHELLAERLSEFETKTGFLRSLSSRASSAS